MTSSAVLPRTLFQLLLILQLQLPPLPLLQISLLLPLKRSNASGTNASTMQALVVHAQVQRKFAAKLTVKTLQVFA
jgi:hypothetical protein